MLLALPTMAMGHGTETLTSDEKARGEETSQLFHLKTEQVATPTKEFKWSNLDLRSNLLYFAGGLFNVGTQYRQSGSSFGYLLNLGYSPFGGGDWEHSMGGWFVSPEVRYYFPSSDNWFAGVQFLAGGYNVKLSELGYQGSVVGGSVMGGYKIELTKCFDIDFTLGVGYGSYSHDTYTHIGDINVLSSQGVRKGALLPQAGVNLIWKIK